ncbi:MAG TPA: lysylphosphatidylglycerol synthase domain-containing protein [Polyangiaceae bacterium]|mgnify:CR=1 FL=1|nr:lysylphosphatidylglycerol synthase domain-containing protein [Polyangiaceae bacterium]
MVEVQPSATAGEASPRAPSVLRSTAAALLSAVFVGYLARLLWLRRAELWRALELDWGTFALLVLLVHASHLQRSVELNYMYRRLGAKERLFDNVMMTGAALLLNYLPLSAGSVARAVALRQRYGLSYGSYVAALTLAAVMNVGTASACGLVACLWLLPTTGAVAPFAALCGALLLGVTAAVLAPAAWVPRGAALPWRLARRLVDRVALIRGRGVGLALLALSSLVKLGLNSLRLWLCFGELGVDLSPLAVMLLGSTALLASIVNLVPSNLGLRELLLGGIAGVVGGSSLIGVAAASLERAVILGYTTLAGLLGLHHTRRVLREGSRAEGAAAPRADDGLAPG